MATLVHADARFSGTSTTGVDYDLSAHLQDGDLIIGVVSDGNFGGASFSTLFDEEIVSLTFPTGKADTRVAYKWWATGDSTTITVRIAAIDSNYATGVLVYRNAPRPFTVSFLSETNVDSGLQTTIAASASSVGVPICVAYSRGCCNASSWTGDAFAQGGSEPDSLAIGTTSASVTKSNSSVFGQEVSLNLVPTYAQVRGSGRVRGSVSEDAGSLLDSVSVNAIDASVSETFLLDASLSSTSLTLFVEALSPGTNAAAYYPLPRQSTGFVNEYAGETILSRMTRVYPAPVMARVEDYVTGSIYTVDGEDFATPQTLLTQLFTDWAATYDWFEYATVPDLRLKVPDPGAINGGDGIGNAIPAQYTADATLGRVGAQVLFYPQTEDEKLTMRQILDELLSPFPGTVVRQNASGQLSIVPSYGPDADTSPSVILTDKDAYTVTTGQPSPDGIINRVTITSQPYTWTEDAGAYNESWFQLAHPGFVDLGGTLYTDGATPGAADLSGTIEGTPSQQSIQDWQPVSSRFVDTAGKVKLTTSSGVKQVSINFASETGGNTGSFDLADITLTDLDIQNDAWQTIIYGTQGVAAVPNGLLTVEIQGKYNPDLGTVSLKVGDRTDLNRTRGLAEEEYVVRVNIADASNVWQKDSASYTGTFGETTGDDPDVLEGGALAASVSAYGVRETSYDVTGYGIKDNALLNEMAQAYVRDAINPKLNRTVDQSVWRAFAIKFSDMGKIIELPSGEQGRLINRSYVDDFGTNFGDGTLASLVKIEVIDQTGDGYIDVDTNYLRLDSGDSLVLDDGTVAEGG